MKKDKKLGDWIQTNRNYDLKFRLKSTKDQKQWMHEHLHVGQSLTIKKDEVQQRINVYADNSHIGEIPSRIYEQISETQKFVKKFEVSEIYYRGADRFEAAEVLWSCGPEVKRTLESIKLVPVEIKKSNTVWLAIDILAIILASILVIYSLSHGGELLWISVGILLISIISFGIHINERGK